MERKFYQVREMNHSMNHSSDEFGIPLTCKYDQPMDHKQDIFDPCSYAVSNHPLISLLFFKVQDPLFIEVQPISDNSPIELLTPHHDVHLWMANGVKVVRKIDSMQQEFSIRSLLELMRHMNKNNFYFNVFLLKLHFLEKILGKNYLNFLKMVEENNEIDIVLRNIAKDKLASFAV